MPCFEGMPAWWERPLFCYFAIFYVMVTARFKHADSGTGLCRSGKASLLPPSPPPHAVALPGRTSGKRLILTDSVLVVLSCALACAVGSKRADRTRAQHVQGKCIYVAFTSQRFDLYAAMQAGYILS